MSTDPRASFSKSSSARGRIAQVLAQARASLNEPTRPVTPQLLDQRTSMSFALEALPQSGKITKVKRRTSEKSHSEKRKQDNYEEESELNDFQSIPQQFTSSTYKQEEDVLDNFAVIQDPNDQHKVEVKKRDKPSWTLSKTISDFLNNLKADDDSKFEETILAIDDATKRLKSSSIDVSASRLQTTQACISELISYVNLYVSHASWIYQLNSALLRFSVASASLEEFSAVSRSVVMQNMEKLAEFVFKSKAQPTMKMATSLEDMDTTVINTADQADTVLLLPVLVDCLLFVMARLNVSFSQLTASSNYKSGKSMELSSQGSVCCLLTTASYCMATLRALSTHQETDRKRLLHANGMDVITQMVLFYDVYSSLIQRLRVTRPTTSSSSSSSAANDEEEEGDDDNDALQTIPVAPLVQVVGVIRNISLDKSGRSQMIDTTLCRTLCIFLKRFSNYAEVIINIARVLAKLSLYETFRAQISNGPRDNKHEYVSCLVSVLRKEADRCLQIMDDGKKGTATDGKDNTEEEEDDEDMWPTWYTWPLISRMAFTLGNFTTTNETNRSLIGDTLKGADSVLLLFQVSVSTLMRISEVKRQREEARSVATNNVFSFAKGLLGGAAALDGPKSSTSDNNNDEYGDVDASSELELRDAIIKLVRLIANLSIDYEVGISMGSDRENLQSLLDLLSISDASVEHEEMVLNVIAALTNLTFYSCQFIDMKLSEEDLADSGVATANNTATHKFVARLDRTLIGIAQRVADGLFHENSEIVLETARVFGNLTRRSSVVQLLFRKRIDEALLMLLTHINTDVISAIAGVFVNISAYAEGRMLLLQRDDPYFVPHVSGMLRKLTLKDIPIAILLTQILYNVITSTDYEQVVKSNKEHRVPPNLFGTLEEWIELVEDAVEQKYEGKEADPDEGSSHHKNSNSMMTESNSSRRKQQQQQSRESQFNAQFIQVAKALSEHIATMGTVSLSG